MEEKNKFAPQERYEKKNGIIVKGFKIKKSIADDFSKTCAKIGKSQGSAISELMEYFIQSNK